MLIPKDAKGKKRGRVLRQLSLVGLDSGREVELAACSLLRKRATAEICPRTGKARRVQYWQEVPGYLHSSFG